jgi:hypothetical protein
MKRTLSLTRETLAELDVAELTNVVGGAQASDRYGRCTLDNSYLICRTVACPMTVDYCGTQ